MLPTREVLQEEFFSGEKDGDDRAEHMSKTHRSASKSLILRTCGVLARHNLNASSIVFVEPVGETSKVAQLIDEASKKQ